MALDLSEIVARARTLDEHLDDVEYRAGAGDEGAVARLHRWTRVAAGGDAAAFERRLLWDGLTPERASAALAGTASPSLGELPAWAHTVDAITRQSSAIARHGWPDAVASPTDAGAPLPYEALLVPAVLVARKRLSAYLASVLAPGTDPLSARAHRDLERALLARLCRISARAIHELFVESLTFGQAARRTMTTGAFRGGERTVHDAFVTALLDEGLAPLFAHYPVLARLVGTVVDVHVTTSAELVRRIHADRDQFDIHFASEAHRAPFGPVQRIDAHLSDFHAEGRTVCALTFASGARLVYKPKPLALDVAFAALLEWCTARGATPLLTCPRVLDMGDYGWVAHVSRAPCEDAAAVARFYERAGMLVGLVYALQGTDCHRGNLVAAGEHLFVVDLETLMHHDARPMSEPHHLVEATAQVIGRFRDSVLRTGFVPRWDFDSDGGAFDVSGLGGADAGSAAEQDLVWRNVGTDDIDLSMGTVRAPLDEGTPTLHGRPLSAGDHVDSLVAGFERMYALLVTHREALLAPGGSLDAFRGCVVRFLFRPTIVYALIRDNALAPDALRDGVDRSIVLEALARGFLTNAERPEAWPIFHAELEAMERLDIPLFPAAADGDALRLENGAVLLRYFDAPSHERVTSHIARMDDDDCARQVEILRLAFVARAARDDAIPVRRTGAAHDRAPHHAAPSADALVAAAATIAEEIASRAVHGGDGSAAWMDIGYAPLAGRFQLQPMGVGLYDGVGGVALFLAGLEHVSGDRRFHELILGALLQPRRLIASLSSARADTARPHVLRLGLGGVTGIGSIIYVLVRVAALIGEPALLDDAARLAELLDPVIIASDEHLDVMNGSAGALLTLLVLHGATGDPRALERARLCGRRLLDARVSMEGPAAAWPTMGGRVLAGFSHGASGIAHALLRLHAITGDQQLLEAAVEGMAYERRLYSSTDNGWPDLRGEGAPRYASTWCNGAAGIALARAAACAMVGSPDITEDVQLAIRAVQTAGTEGVHHLCCGSAGRVEALLVASRIIDEPEWRDDADAGAAALLASGSTSGEYHLFANAPPAAYSPGFFRGTAGIGYQFLRLASPALPSALLLD